MPPARARRAATVTQKSMERRWRAERGTVLSMKVFCSSGIRTHK